MSDLTKLEEVAARLLAGMMMNSAWPRAPYPNMAEGAVSAAKALLAECAKHEPTTEQSLTVAPEIPWIDHDGGEMPCKAGQRIEVVFREWSCNHVKIAAHFRWQHDGGMADIMKWRPVS
jgi:hypothetical protein